MEIKQENTGEYQELGQRIFEAFTYAGLGNDSLRSNAKKIEISAPAFGRALHGKHSISNKTGMKISKLTNVNHNWLMTGNGTMTQDHLENCQCFQGLDDKQRTLITGVIAGMRLLNEQV